VLRFFLFNIFYAIKLQIQRSTDNKKHNMENYQNYSMDDIIFENRNKAYGAYQLRQLVDRNATYGLLATASAILVLIIVTTLMPHNSKPILRNPIVVEIQEIDVDPIRPKAPKHAPAKQVTKAATVPTKAFVAMQATETSATTETTPPKQTELLTAMVGTVNNNQIAEVATVTTENVKTGIETSTNTVSTAIPEKQKIERWVEVMPSFIGGNEALLKYLKKNITMDSRDIDNGISGKVTIQFYVDIDGSIRDAKVIKDTAGGRCAERALAVINKMPKWNPGMQGSKAVRVYHSIPISFQVN
jgi:periplasmic protein TonB